MGCFYSKMGPRPSGFSREVSLSLKRRIADFAPLEDILAARTSGKGDRFLSLLYAANAVSIKLRSPERRLHEDQPPPVETINAWELMAGLEEAEEGDPDCEERGGCGKGGIFEQGSSPPAAGDSDGGREGRPPSDLAVPEAPRHATDGTLPEDLPESGQRGKDRTFPAGEEAAEPPAPSPQLGHRRKAAAGDLRLKVPSFDFARRRGGEDGPAADDGSYETPRFGSYGPEGGGGAGAVFDPELVAELEKALERLSEEEEDALRRIVEECMDEAGE